jgi:uncharacterized protein (DUF58 family)
MSRTARSRELKLRPPRSKLKTLFGEGVGMRSRTSSVSSRPQGLQQELVYRRPVELPPGEEVRDLHRVEAPLPKTWAYWALCLEDGRDRRPVDAAEEALVTGAIEVEAGSVAATAPEAVGVAKTVGGDEPSQLREEFPGEGVVAAEAFRLGDEAEQALRIASRECRHGSPKIRRTTYRLQSPNG